MVCFALVACRSNPPPLRERLPMLAPVAAVSVIIDTDIGEDADDLGAFAVLHHLADRGEARILAAGYCNSAPYGVPATRVVNAYYGHEVPVGAPVSAGHPGVDHYGTFLASLDRGRAAAPAEPAHRVYRRALAASADRSVTLMFQGQLPNLLALYRSGPDDISPMNGEELLLAKARELVILGGMYPSGREHDFISDPVAAQVVNLLHRDLPVTWSGYDNGVEVLTRSTQEHGPVRAGYDEFFRVYGGTKRSSWGAIVALYTVRGLGTTFIASERGTNEVDAAGRNNFQTDGKKNQRYIRRAVPVADLAALIESMM